MNTGSRTKKNTHPDSLKVLLADSSRKLADLTAHMVYNNPPLFSDLITIALSDENPYSPRAARVLSIFTQQYPELIRSHRNRIIQRMPSLHNEGAIRSLLKIYAELPMAYTTAERSVLLNLCFDFLSSSDTSVALKAYSMEILYRISEKIPEIRSELYFVIDGQMPFASAGYKSRGSKILKKLMHECH